MESRKTEEVPENHVVHLIIPLKEKVNDLNHLSVVPHHL